MWLLNSFKHCLTRAACEAPRDVWQDSQAMAAGFTPGRPWRPHDSDALMCGISDVSGSTSLMPGIAIITCLVEKVDNNQTRVFGEWLA